MKISIVRIAVSTMIPAVLFRRSAEAFIRSTYRGPKQANYFRIPFYDVKQFSSARVEKDEESEKIFYGDRIPFETLGLCSDVITAAKAIGAPCSTVIQSLAIPHIMSGKDVILAAETGSGKTLAYLLPLLHDHVTRIVAPASDELLGNAKCWEMFPESIILVPNRALCEQVKQVTLSLLREMQHSITVESFFGGSWDYPYSERHAAPDILICTPSFLAGYGSLRNIPMFVKARCLIIDEADMLMDGNYSKQLNDILVGFRRASRFDPKLLPSASPRNSNDSSHKKYLEPSKTQFVLSAATIPNYGLKSIEALVRKSFPSAVRVTAPNTHRQHPALQVEWIDVTDCDESLEKDLELRNNVLLRLISQNREERTMVFANTASSCKAAFAILEEAGISAAPFHKDLLQDQRAENLASFCKGDVKVLVCTDLAARGLDIPDVQHIIQYNFALNVVQHLHRIGRAARAGRRGKATVLLDESGRELARSIRKVGPDGAVDSSFSRKRGFRKKLKKNANSELENRNN